MDADGAEWSGHGTEQNPASLAGASRTSHCEQVWRVVRSLATTERPAAKRKESTSSPLLLAVHVVSLVPTAQAGQQAGLRVGLRAAWLAGLRGGHANIGLKAAHDRAVACVGAVMRRLRAWEKKK